MTMESRQPEEAQSGSDLIPSAALSSADLWHEILGRLNEVQEGQLKLARAIESLGMIVCEALSVNPQAAIAGGEATALLRPPQRVLAAGPSAPPNGEQTPVDAHDLASTQRTIDSLLGDDVFAPAGPTRQMATTGSTTSPRFYVAPVPEESRQPAREPVASGSWPRGRRVARGLAREAPPMAGPAIVPNLTPAAIDALLAAEFGEVPAPRKAPPTVVQATGSGTLLNSLLGSAFETVAPVPAPPGAPVNASATAAAAPSVSSRPAFAPPPPPPMAPTRAPSMTQPTPAPTPLATPAPSVPSAPSPLAARPSQPPMAAPQSPPWSPTVDPRRSVGTPAPTAGAAAPPPVPPRTTPGAGPSPLLPPPVALPPASSPGPGAVNAAIVPDLPTGPDLSTAAVAAAEGSAISPSTRPRPTRLPSWPRDCRPRTGPRRGPPVRPARCPLCRKMRRPRRSAATPPLPWPPRFSPPLPAPRSSSERKRRQRCWPRTSPSWPRDDGADSACAEQRSRPGLGRWRQARRPTAGRRFRVPGAARCRNCRPSSPTGRVRRCSWSGPPIYTCRRW